MNGRAVQRKSLYCAKLSAYSEVRQEEASQDTRQRIPKTCGDNYPCLHGSTAECHQPTIREQPVGHCPCSNLSCARLKWTLYKVVGLS